MNNNVIQLVIVITGVLASSIANAAIYKCEHDGTVEFSQQPCGFDAKLIVIEDHQLQTNPNSVPKPVALAKQNDELDRYIRLKQIAVKKAEHFDKIDTYTARLNSEIAALNNQADEYFRSSFGAKKAAAVAEQMTAVSERYNLLIDNEQRNIDRLNAEQASLESTLSKTENTEIDSYIRSEQIKRKMTEHKNKIDSYYDELNQQIAKLQQQADKQAINLSNVNKDYALSAKMSAVTKKYNTLIAVEQRQLDRLSNELVKL
ncbi:hypothetical protein CWC25_08450 [Pseudoalteromonas sp. S4389]|uniref:hypothetical protein n=1 Tax=Pseudoalteromonas sp. S4389 TaxID=579556 RepID=UPI0011082D09|nr:hypothetical protein [Pseudoalteromonas sp. S4389]TMO44955.1 hypothetical protein CWC25_08450 [Pseudoalteromonas sp. S4389]